MGQSVYEYLQYTNLIARQSQFIPFVGTVALARAIKLVNSKYIRAIFIGNVFHLGPGNLRGSKKLKFLLPVKRGVVELLTLPLLKTKFREIWATNLRKPSNISEDIFRNWLVQSL